MDIAAPLTQHVLGLKYEAIPKEAIASAKAFFADSIAVGIAGVNAPMANEVMAAAMLWGEPGARYGRVLGSPHRLPPASAAFVNSFQIHCQEYDCVHENAVVHPLATILPALLATAETHGDPSGSEFLLAMIGAVDVAVALGVAANSPLKFFRPATAGLFGATLGVAKLRGFDEVKARSALGIALAHCSGTMQPHIEGKPTLAIQAANASRAAIMACDLAAIGMDGPQDVFEGKFGYFPLFEDESEPQAAVRNLGRIFRITEVSHKTHPTGRAAQGGLAAVKEVVAKALAAGLDPTTMKSATLSAPPIVKRLVGRPYIEGLSINYARLCFSYLAAIVILHGEVSFAAFSQDMLTDAEVAKMAKRIDVVVNDETDEATFAPQTFSVVFDECQTINCTIQHQPGSPNDPLTDAEQFAKFLICLEQGLGEQVSGDAKACWVALHDLGQQPFSKTIDRLDSFVGNNPAALDRPLKYERNRPNATTSEA